jgi:hypothetical protein
MAIGLRVETFDVFDRFLVVHPPGVVGGGRQLADGTQPSSSSSRRTAPLSGNLSSSTTPCCELAQSGWFNFPFAELGFSSKTSVHHYDGSNVDLGTAAGKLYRVGVMSIQDAGDSDLVSLHVHFACGTC